MPTSELYVLLTALQAAVVANMPATIADPVQFTLPVAVLSLFSYSFGGWLWETLFCSLIERHPVKRGFLNGPLCPIYGVGAVVVYALLGSITSPTRVFVMGAVLTTGIEYATGRLLEERFGRRWWDYSSWPLNYRGLINPIASLTFGLFSVTVVFAIEPQLIALFTSWGSQRCSLVALLCLIALAYDLLATVSKLDGREGASRWLEAPKSVRAVLDMAPHPAISFRITPGKTPDIEEQNIDQQAK